jgi:hypothetical protein
MKHAFTQPLSRKPERKHVSRAARKHACNKKRLHEILHQPKFASTPAHKGASTQICLLERTAARKHT